MLTGKAPMVERGPGADHQLKTAKDNLGTKLPALVYDILPSTTAVFSYVIVSWKLSANEQFFVCAQTVASLLQTTQIKKKKQKKNVSFIAANKVYTSTNKITIVWIKTELFSSVFLPGVDTSHVYVGAWALGCFHSPISTRTFRRALTASVDSCAEMKSDKSGRVWRKMPESDARSVPWTAKEEGIILK